jgi:50S ribosomal protein L16 3-hydroxylase
LKSRKRPAALDIGRFMRRHWQRAPLLVRGAFEAFDDPLSPREVLALARSPDAVSRLVQRRGKSWSLEHGPFTAKQLSRLPPRDWTVLVQDTNHFSARAAELLAAFDFIPHARIDDVMVSYAVPGGGVGPHVDSYDVFLLQGRGERRWRISRQRDHAFVPGLPLRILQRFEPEEEWVLRAGDMLYLPPGIAHEGVATSECLTWSIGFRAPSDAELARGFLDHLDEHLDMAGHYGDAGARAVRHPGQVPRAMTEHVARTLARIRWSRADVADFTGRYLSEPKPHVFFSAPARAPGRAAFEAQARRHGVALDPCSRLLFSGTMFFINGERLAVPAAARPLLRRLADERTLPAPLAAPAAFWEIVHEWHRRGWLRLARGAS